MEELLKAPSSPAFTTIFITVIVSVITLLTVAHFILILKFPESDKETEENDNYKEPEENDKIANISYIMFHIILLGISGLFAYLFILMW